MQRTLRTGIAALAMLLLPLIVADAQPAAPDCTVNAPVCGLKNGSRQTYWNACLAARDGAQFLNEGECRGSRSYG